MKRLLFVLSLAAIHLSVSAQQLARYEYWFDHNSDHRIQTSYTDSIIAIKVNANGLLTGIHSFSFRALDSEGRWSSPFTSYFLHVPSGQATWTYEYWFDGDHAHRTTQQGTGSEANLMIDANALSVGIHSLHFRAHDEAGRWSSPLTAYFMRMQIGDAAWTYEYWFDNDHAHRVTGQGTGDVVSLDISAQHLSVGIHSFNFRAKDEAGRWSVPVTTYFFRAGNNFDPAATYTYEYWLDENANQKVSGTSADGLISLDIDASSMKAGIHFLTLRIKDDHDRWASPLYHYFVKPHTKVDNLVTAYYFWFNGHVEDAQLVRLAQPASPLLLDVSLPTNNLEQEVTRENITMLTTPDGQQQLAMKNVLAIQFLDERGHWSETQIDTFAVAVGDRVVSLTPFIVNPEADEQWKGWTTQGNRSIASDGHWSGEKNNHFCLGNGKDSEMRQTVSGLPAGTYMLSAYGKVPASGQLSMSVAGYTADFPSEGEENGWSMRTVTFVTDGEPFDIVVMATGLPSGQWACIDGFSLTVNGIVDKAGTVSLSDVQIASIADLSTWNSPGSPVRLQLEGHYDNKKGREATIYYSIDNGSPMRLADAVAPDTQFGQEVECFFRENASPHTISLYGKDTEGVMSERVVLEIGNISRGCTVENLPQTAVYTGEAIEIGDLVLRDIRTGNLLTEGEDYTLTYINNVDDGQATIVVEGVYPSYMGRRELHFVIKSFIADNELAVLRTLYEQTAGDSLWTRKWNLEKEQVLSDELPGVSVKNGHVTAIQLRSNHLKGQLPDAIFSLPQLQTLNLEDNAISGSLNTSAIKPALRELYVARNGLSRLSGSIPTTVEKLSLGGQDMEEVSALHLSQPGLEAQILTLPNIGLYDHQQHNFERQADIRLMADDYSNNTVVMLSQRDGQWLLRNDEWGKRVYREAQGDTIYCCDDANNRFRLALTFNPGDANMDALVNVQDLSSVIFYCLNDYQATFNYTAANLWEDERVNVQDAVCLVNILLESTPPAATLNVSNTSRMAESGIHRAMLTVADGQLVLSSSTPVSAFDIIVEGVRPEDVTSLIEPLGFMVSKRQHGNGTHIVGYSPAGGLLPIGETAICSFAKPKPQVTHAILADDRAKAISIIVNEQTDIDEVSEATMEVALRNNMITITTTKAMSNIRWTLLTLGGTVLDGGELSGIPAGISQIPCHIGKGGIAILRLSADGKQPIVKKVNNK